MAGIERDLWLKEMERLSAAAKMKSDEGWTTDEWAGKLKTSRALALKAIRNAHKHGRVALGQRTVTRIDGRPTQVPVYAIIPK